MGGILLRWFADLPIERKLRMVITVPAMAAFGIALAMRALTALHDDPSVNKAELYLPGGVLLATYRRTPYDAHLRPAGVPGVLELPKEAFPDVGSPR